MEISNFNCEHFELSSFFKATFNYSTDNTAKSKDINIPYYRL